MDTKKILVLLIAISFLGNIASADLLTSITPIKSDCTPDGKYPCKTGETCQPKISEYGILLKYECTTKAYAVIGTGSPAVDSSNPSCSFDGTCRLGYTCTSGFCVSDKYTKCSGFTNTVCGFAFNSCCGENGVCCSPTQICSNGKCIGDKTFNYFFFCANNKYCDTTIGGTTVCTLPSGDCTSNYYLKDFMGEGEGSTQKVFNYLTGKSCNYIYNEWLPYWEGVFKELDRNIYRTPQTGYYSDTLTQVLQLATQTHVCDEKVPSTPPNSCNSYGELCLQCMLAKTTYCSNLQCQNINQCIPNTKPRYCFGTSSGSYIGDNCLVCGCPTGEDCVGNTCVKQSHVLCGDGTCNGNENQDTCCKDCNCPTGKNCVSNQCVIQSTNDKCSDRTVYGVCSTKTIPRYCSNGNLVVDLGKCPCPSNTEYISSSMSCKITDTSRDCGSIKNGECDNTGRICYEGKLNPNCGYCKCPTGFECKNTVCYQTTNVCIDGTPNGKCSGNIPMYCNLTISTTLIPNCGVCGCNTPKSCLNDGTCMSGETKNCPTISKNNGECASGQTGVYCENGKEVYKCSVCGCPQILDTSVDTNHYECNKTSDECYLSSGKACIDGTNVGMCSVANKGFGCTSDYTLVKLESCGGGGGGGDDTLILIFIIITTLLTVFVVGFIIINKNKK